MSSWPREKIRLEGQRLVLRNFESGDKRAFYASTQDPEIYKTLPEDHPYSEQEVSEIIDWFVSTYPENRKEAIVKLPLAILLKDSEELIGDIGIGQSNLDKSETEVFYFINSKYWGKGYVSEAMQLLMGYILENGLVKRLVATVVPGNIASVKILLKNGFRRIENVYGNGNELYERCLP